MLLVLFAVFLLRKNAKNNDFEPNNIHLIFHPRSEIQIILPQGAPWELIVFTPIFLNPRSHNN